MLQRDKQEAARRFLRLAALFVTGCFSLPLFCCSSPDGNVSAQRAQVRIVARIGDRSISRAEFLAEFARRHYSQARDFLRELAFREAMMREARACGIRVEPSELAEYVKRLKRAYGPGKFEEYLRGSGLSYAEWLKRAKQDLIRSKLIEVNVAGKVQITPEELSEYYSEHREEFAEPKRMKVRQIVVSSKKTAEHLLSLLRRRRRSFESLAQEYSIAPEAASGGDLGWVVEKELASELRDPIFSLSPGKISKIIHTSYGYHIFKVEAVREARVPELDEVRQRVKDQLFKEKADKRYKDWASALRQKWHVQVFPERIL